MPLEPGTTLGTYEIVSPIGADTGIEIYKATDAANSRTVAIQIIPPEWSAGSEFPAQRSLQDTKLAFLQLELRAGESHRLAARAHRSVPAPIPRAEGFLERPL